MNKEEIINKAILISNTYGILGNIAEKKIKLEGKTSSFFKWWQKELTREQEKFEKVLTPSGVCFKMILFNMISENNDNDTVSFRIYGARYSGIYQSIEHNYYVILNVPLKYNTNCDVTLSESAAKISEYIKREKGKIDEFIQKSEYFFNNIKDLKKEIEKKEDELRGLLHIVKERVDGVSIKSSAVYF